MIGFTSSLSVKGEKWFITSVTSSKWRKEAHNGIKWFNSSQPK